MAVTPGGSDSWSLLYSGQEPPSCSCTNASLDLLVQAGELVSKVKWRSGLGMSGCPSRAARAVRCGGWSVTSVFVVLMVNSRLLVEENLWCVCLFTAGADRGDARYPADSGVGPVALHVQRTVQSKTLHTSCLLDVTHIMSLVARFWVFLCSFISYSRVHFQIINFLHSSVALNNSY